jgi:hypothetical protein
LTPRVHTKITGAEYEHMHAIRLGANIGDMFFAYLRTRVQGVFWFNFSTTYHDADTGVKTENSFNRVPDVKIVSIRGQIVKKILTMLLII